LKGFLQSMSDPFIFLFIFLPTKYMSILQYTHILRLDFGDSDVGGLSIGNSDRSDRSDISDESDPASIKTTARQARLCFASAAAKALAGQEEPTPGTSTDRHRPSQTSTDQHGQNGRSGLSGQGGQPPPPAARGTPPLQGESLWVRDLP
jgi:hypothetical protein